MEDTISKLLKAIFGSTMVIALIVLMIVSNVYLWYKQIQWEQKPEIYSYFWWCESSSWEDKVFVAGQIGVVFIETTPPWMFNELVEAIWDKEGCSWEPEDLHFSIQNIKSLRLWN